MHHVGEMGEILFADDDDAFREMTADVLRAAGYSVRPVRNGTDALTEVRRREPDLLLLDYRMGRPNGLEVCQEVKSDPSLAHLPVLILTGEGRLEDRLAGFDSGADDYLPKPFDPRELVARVRALLRLSKRSLDRNPTSGLPGGEAIHTEILRRRDLGEPFSVCYFDLDNFKPFSDRFGFTVADGTIQEVGRILREFGEHPGVFVGHVGGDDFVLVGTVEEVPQLSIRAQESFRTRLLRLLPAEAVRAGSYTAEDREGRVREFALPRLSAAIARVDPARWTSLDRFGERVAELKGRAKRPGGPGIEEADLVP
ncbi:MAG TPA: response regulator [Longimicrobiaceae bacterium]|nr:response regulator [Longimicrobiaceae bacterium]